MGNGFIKNIKYLCNCLLDVIYSDDRGCVICNEYVSENRNLCTICLGKVKKCKGYFEIHKENLNIRCYSATYYSYIIKRLILNLKYKSDFKSGEVLARYMLEAIKNNGIGFDIITYVPLTKQSIKKRGYNQGRYLAKFIGDETNKKVYRTLKKCKETKDQIGLGKEERWSNLKNSFQFVNLKCFQNKRILIVDDVITTGATGFYCAKILMENGAKNVVVLSAAKSSI
ncbi:ComF family protein [Clostridium sp. MB40-C1]|uniref:ComF family protein n=1 Tax=Clostridium sp. MB40-C1 TaxID=3070996 RepID=UPI0027DEE6E3|nr:ComF family protein [Clostridium sp. MB40-C1]WMJ79657.1 ComF family protein [Clostridium sp. MB40-C1]